MSSSNTHQCHKLVLVPSSSIGDKKITSILAASKLANSPPPTQKTINYLNYIYITFILMSLCEDLVQCNLLRIFCTFVRLGSFHSNCASLTKLNYATLCIENSIAHPTWSPKPMRILYPAPSHTLI